MAPAQFRIIIVGGGVVGLTAANMLAKANIDFVVLERGSSLVPELGASLAIWSSTLRIFDQLGLYDAILENSSPVLSTTMLTHEGKQYDRQEFCDKKYLGHSGRVSRRSSILKVLFDGLSAESKARIHTDKKVTGMSVREDGVTVTCQDGSAFEGSMVLGTDGVHSIVRNLSRELALHESPKAIVNSEKPFLSTFKVVFGSVPKPKDISLGDTYEAHGKDISTQFFCDRDMAFFFVYQRLDTNTQERVSYDEKEMEQFIEETGHIHMTPGVTVRDIYAQRINSGMVNLDEGIVDSQDWKRVLLVGDSCHKMTPNFGFGYHSSVWDLAVLVNHLREHLLAHPDDQIDTPTLVKIFSRYQEARGSHNKTLMKLSAGLTRSATWQTWVDYLLDRFLLPWTHSMTWMTPLVLVPLLKVCPVLNWLPEPNFKSGSTPWDHMPKLGDLVE
ncbi:FAD/NAD(P)-binding domain-containing protein [Thozetella sp. PMI_491]|nr:FAD/NAD(P)-binding domain-containing protein [Thozetella sp. PMI_491]